MSFSDFLLTPPGALGRIYAFDDELRPRRPIRNYAAALGGAAWKAYAFATTHAATDRVDASGRANIPVGAGSNTENLTVSLPRTGATFNAKTIKVIVAAATTSVSFTEVDAGWEFRGGTTGSGHATFGTLIGRLSHSRAPRFRVVYPIDADIGAGLRAGTTTILLGSGVDAVAERHGKWRFVVLHPIGDILVAMGSAAPASGDSDYVVALGGRPYYCWLDPEHDLWLKRQGSSNVGGSIEIYDDLIDVGA